ncbi:MAG: hypothetical protein LQ351_004948 [Letrouitia transgressa]|nr:MAG: hypothetical protein LQ351_004948 [Letrouitia transgressa]
MLKSAVRTVSVLAIVFDLSELDQMLGSKQRRIHEQSGVFTSMTKVTATTEELEEARKMREQLTRQMHEQQELARNESDVRLLTEALRSLGTLTALTVEAAVAQGFDSSTTPSSAREWHPVWIRASHVFRTVTLSIAQSSIEVDNLRFFQISRRCSVPTWDLNEHIPALEAANFVQAATSIKSIFLSVSTKVETDHQKILDARSRLSKFDQASYDLGMGTSAGLLPSDDPKAIAAGNYPGVARLLNQMPNLERLDLHLYNTLEGSADNYAKVFTCIADDVTLPSLRHCTLSGLYSSEVTLLQFLRTHDALETFELREIGLVSGSWSSVLAYMCTMPLLQRVILQNLWEPSKSLLNLESKDGQKSTPGGTVEDRNCSYPCFGGMMVHTRTFSREVIQKERFQFMKCPSGRPLGSAALHRWIYARKAEYGPP